MKKTLAQNIIEKSEPMAQLLKSLAHPTRLRILCNLMDGEKSVGELQDFCEISQSAMSRFLARMKNEGIVTSRREHHFIYYRISSPQLVQLLQAMKEIYC